MTIVDARARHAGLFLSHRERLGPPDAISGMVQKKVTPPGVAGVDARRATPGGPRLPHWGLAGCRQLDPSLPAPVTWEPAEMEPCPISSVLSIRRPRLFRSNEVIAPACARRVADLLSEPVPPRHEQGIAVRATDSPPTTGTAPWVAAALATPKREEHIFACRRG